MAETEDDVPDGLARGRRSTYWTRIKKKWNRRGVVEIDVDHHEYDMLECIRDGLREVLTNRDDLGPKDELTAADYTHVERNAITSPNGKVFHFSSYASTVFATLRQAIGLSEECFLQSITPQELPYLEFISNSKSGQSFYLSNDKAYFMKTDKKSCIDYLLNILGDYLDHFLSFPHSLIVKYLGLFSVRVEGGTEKYFYVMQSIFYPVERIEKRYDVKGCLAGRYQKPAEPGSNVIQVLKDRNFLDEVIDIGDERDWLVKQIKHDAHFLSTLGVQDYSLLVGIQELHEDEKTQDLGDIVRRVQQSMPMPKVKPSPKVQKPATDSTITQITEVEKSQSLELQIADSRENMNNNANTAQGRIQARKRPTLGHGKTLSFVRKEVTDSMGGRNRRLLPKAANPLHIINGPKYRYFIGIIDFFTLYECRQKTGRILKSIKFCCRDHSTIPPPQYAERFVNFMVEHIK